MARLLSVTYLAIRSDIYTRYSLVSFALVKKKIPVSYDWRTTIIYLYFIEWKFKNENWCLDLEILIIK